MKNKELIVDNGKLTREGFKTVFVKDIAEKIQYGYTGKSIDKGSYRYLRITDIQNNKVDWESVPFSDIEGEEQIEKYKLKTNDIVFARTGATVGKSFLIEEIENSVFASYLIRIVPKQQVFPKFLQYFFQSDDYWTQIRGHEVGAAQPNVNGKKLGKLKIPLPPLPEQRRIVSKLDGLFAEIDASLALIDQNIEQAEALKLSVLDEEFSMDNEQLKINNLLEKTKNIHPKKEFSNEEFTYLDISSVDKDKKVIEKPKILKGREAPSRAKREVKKGDVLFATTRPNLKNIAIVEEDFNNPIASTGFCLLRTKPDKLLNKYLFYFLLTNIVQDLIQPFIRGAQYPAISDSNLKSLKIPLSDIETQQEIVQRLDALFEEIDGLVSDYQQKREDLEALKSSLLDQAFKGEL